MSKLLERFPDLESLEKHSKEPEAKLTAKYYQALEARNMLRGKISQYLIPTMNENGEIEMTLDPYAKLEIADLQTKFSSADADVASMSAKIAKVDEFVERMAAEGWNPDNVSVMKLKGEMSALAGRARDRRALVETVASIQARYAEVEEVNQELWGLFKQ